MKHKTITVAELSSLGGISRSAIYKAIRNGGLSWNGEADPVKLLAEWRRKRDPSRDGKIGPALEQAMRKIGIPVPPEARPMAGALPADGIDANGVPIHFSGETRRLWKAINDEYELEDSALLTLKLACESYDRAQQARRIIAAEGLVLNGRRHPAIDVESQAQATFLRAMRSLGLDVEQPGPIGRPPGR